MGQEKSYYLQTKTNRNKILLKERGIRFNASVGVAGDNMTCRLQLTRTYADKVFHFKIFRIKILLKERGITAEPLCEHQFLINLLLSFQDHVAVNGLWKVVGTENVLWLEAVEVLLLTASSGRHDIEDDIKFNEREGVARNQKNNEKEKRNK